MKERALSRVTDRGRLGARSLTATGAFAEWFQSSIRSRWADQSVVRNSRAQSSGRPSCISEAMTFNELARAAARSHPSRRRNQIAGGDHEEAAMALLART